jgi:hypothetical protein
MRPVLIAGLALVLLAPSFARKNEKAEAGAQARAVLEKYLAARFSGAAWRAVSDQVMWPERDEPACVTVVRSYTVSGLRLKQDGLALGTVIFYVLGDYCPAKLEFRSAPHLETALYQLRRRSVVWRVEKTNRPGAHVDWKLVQAELEARAADPALSREQVVQAATAALTLEKTANAIGQTGAEKVPPESPPK